MHHRLHHVCSLTRSVCRSDEVVVVNGLRDGDIQFSPITVRLVRFWRPCHFRGFDGCVTESISCTESSLMFWTRPPILLMRDSRRILYSSKRLSFLSISYNCRYVREPWIQSVVRLWGSEVIRIGHHRRKNQEQGSQIAPSPSRHMHRLGNEKCGKVALSDSSTRR